MNDIYFKAFVVPFYRSLLGFWILVLVFGGVFMEFRQHVLLGKFLFTHTLPFFILPLGFLLYAGFHLRWQLLLLRVREYHIFHQTALNRLPVFNKNWAVVALANHAIVIGYCIFLSFFGVEKGAWSSLAILWLSIVVSLSVSVRIIFQQLSRPLKETVLLRPRWKHSLPRFTWFILELRQNRPILLLLTKGLSLILLNGFFLSFQTGVYDHRWLEFGILCSSFLQIPILMEKAEFEQTRMEWFKSLPVQFTQKLLTHLVTCALMLSPELLFLVWKGLQASQGTALVPLPFLLIALALGLQALLYRFRLDSFFPYSFGLFVCCFFLILFAVPWVLPVAGFIFYFITQIRSPFRN
jgi:hypothetical protein